MPGNATPSPGVGTQMQNLGLLDQVLNGPPGPDTTFFRAHHETYSYFTFDFVDDDFDQITLGAKLTFELSRAGDMAHKQWARLLQPGIIGTRTGAAASADYPSLVPDLECDPVNNANRCLPGQELAVADMFDFVESAEEQGGALVAQPFAHYVYGAPVRALEEMKMVCGNNTVDELTHDVIHVTEELAGGPGRRSVDLHFKYPTREELILHSLYDHESYVPLPWYFCQVSGLSFPLASVSSQKVTYTIKWADKKHLIVKSNPLVQVFLSEAKALTGAVGATDIADMRLSTGGLYPGDTTQAGIRGRFISHDRKATANPFANTSFTGGFVTQYIFLSDDERQNYTDATFDQVITQHQVQVQTFNGKNGKTFKIPLELAHPVKELLVFGRLDANESANAWYNYSKVGPSSYSAGGRRGAMGAVSTDTATAAVDAAKHSVVNEAGLAAYSDGAVANTHSQWLADPRPDIFKTLGLKFANQDRFQARPAKFWRQPVCKAVHSKIPDPLYGELIYCLPFALFPEDSQTTGAANFSRYDKVDLVGEFETDYGTHEQSMSVTVIAKSVNLMSYKKGTGAPRYS